MLTCLLDENNVIFERVCQSCYNTLNLKGRAFVEFVWADPENMQVLNKQERGIDKVTDVLSFPLLEFNGKIKAFTKKNYPLSYMPENKSIALGSVVICKQQAKLQAEEYGHSVQREVDYLFIHGVLHLLGYDHQTDKSEKQMHDLAESILAGVIITGDPSPSTK